MRTKTVLKKALSKIQQEEYEKHIVHTHARLIAAKE